ncbi:MAG: helix-turn-helix transcriptional regulator [bacterium]
MASDSLVIRHSSEFGDWESIIRTPHARLDGYISSMSGWVERTSFSRRREVPFAGCVMIINIDNRLKVSASGEAAAVASFESFFAGIHTGFVVTESTGWAGGIQVNFSPLGAYRILGIPAHELANRTVHLTDVLGPAARRLGERISDVPDWESRFDLIEDFLFDRLASAPPTNEGIAWAWNAIELSQGTVSIASLVGELGMRPADFIAGFREQIGLAPKQVARIVRFSRAAALLSPDEMPRLAEIAAECGYYDQAHFAREFREFAGSTPWQYFDRLMPANGGLLDEDPGVGRV